MPSPLGPYTGLGGVSLAVSFFSFLARLQGDPVLLCTVLLTLGVILVNGWTDAPNAIATAAMMKAGADRGATGETPVLVACRDADIIAGPIGILMADALMGEITPAIAEAIGQSRAQKVLLPVNSHCGKIVVGVRELTLSRIMDEAVEVLRELCAPQATTL